MFTEAFMPSVGRLDAEARRTPACKVLGIRICPGASGRTACAHRAAALLLGIFSATEKFLPACDSAVADSGRGNLLGWYA